MTNASSRVERSLQELRVVARYAAERAGETLSIFEESCPGDRRPREAVEAAWMFAEGAARTALQRTSALAAHEAAQEAASAAAQEAARAAGGDRRVGAQRIEQARQRATPALVAVLRRYPAAPSNGNRVANS